MSTISKVVVEQVTADVINLHSDGKSLAFIQAVVSDKHGVPARTVKQIINSLNLTKGSGAQGDLVALVKVMRENHGKVTREALVSMMAEQSGYTESTANHMLSQLNFAKEYHKQESNKGA